MQTGIVLEIDGRMMYNLRHRSFMYTPILADDLIQNALEMQWGALDLFDKGGPLMWVLLFLSVVALMVFFICLWTTRSSAVIPSRLVMSVESCLRRKDNAGLLSLCEKDGSSFALTIHVIVMFLQRNPRAGIEEVKEVAGAEGTRQTNLLTRQVNWLSDIGSIAPMIGLLGTVLGMMQTFWEMAQGNFEGVKQMQMASGIAVAMITTAGGLVLAIPSMAAYAFFRSRLQKSITDMEVAITHILSVIAVQMDRERRLGNMANRGTATEVMDDDF